MVSGKVDKCCTCSGITFRDSIAEYCFAASHSSVRTVAIHRPSSAVAPKRNPEMLKRLPQFKFNEALYGTNDEKQVFGVNIKKLLLLFIISSLLLLCCCLL